MFPDGAVQISAVRLLWPWVSRRAIRETLFFVEAPDDVTYGHRNPIWRTRSNMYRFILRLAAPSVSTTS